MSGRSPVVFWIFAGFCAIELFLFCANVGITDSSRDHLIGAGTAFVLMSLCFLIEKIYCRIFNRPSKHRVQRIQIYEINAFPRKKIK